MQTIRGRICRIGRYTSPEARLVSGSNEVSVETAVHFMVDGDPTIYTSFISRFSTREKAVSLALAQVGDEVAFSMIDAEEVGEFVNLSVPVATPLTA